MNGWLYSQKRKRHQRALNSLVREVNKAIEQDDIWNGRFYIRQKDARWYIYEDKSGADLYVTLCFIDKVTGMVQEYRRTVNQWRFAGGCHMYWAMNDFIVEKVRA